MRHLWAGLAVNPALPPRAVDRLIEYADPELAGELAGRPDLTRGQVAALAALGEDVAVKLARAGALLAQDVDPQRRPRAALALLEEGRAPVEWARRLADLPELRAALVACPGLPADVTARLAEDADPEVVADLGWYTVDPSVLTRLAAHPSTQVRRGAAANEATPPAVLADLLADRPPAGSCPVCERHPVPWAHAPDCQDVDCGLPPGAYCDGTHAWARQDIRLLVLGNPAAPTEAVARHLDEPSLLLRIELARRTDLDAAAYAHLAVDPVPWLRWTIAENPAVGEPLLRVLAEDDSDDVRRRVARHPRVPLDVLDRLAGTVKLGPNLVQRIAAATEEEVRQLAASPNPGLRVLLAQRRDLPADVRDALLADRDAKVAGAIAGHPGLEEARLRDLLARFGRQVATSIAANPEATAALLAEIVRAESPNVRALRAVAVHPHADGASLTICLSDPKAKLIAARHPALPPQILAWLLDDPDEAVAEAAAANPALPEEDRERLMP
ncbi:hypothetical protein AB0K51_13575 [Kitasatospora sp. NPDC049285]|uniref:hypothetical protein n=1 Tax=Kitasatospora sp. NPDC049285 TaxID=3157096 RepID=UPI0034221362